MSFVNTVDVIGDEALANSIIDRSITEIADNLVASIGEYVFYECKALTAASFLVATNIGSYAFNGCSALTTANFPAATRIRNNAFSGCPALTTANFPAATSIEAGAFSKCYHLTALILRSETMCTLYDTNAFAFCYHILGTADNTYNPDGLADGYIYVPRALVDSYKADSKWSKYANQFRALEDYTVDGTTTGALDESKI